MKKANTENHKTGWIKLYRSIQTTGFYNKSAYVHLWVHLLIKANHQGGEFIHNGQLKKLKPGQFLTGRNKLSEETGIPQSTIERILKVFESGHQIEQQKDNRKRVITILNWDSYQHSEQQSEHQTDIKRTSNGHQTDTNNNVINKEDEELKSENKLLHTLEDFETEHSWKILMAKNHNLTLDRVNFYLEVFMNMIEDEAKKKMSSIKFKFNAWLGNNKTKNQKPKGGSVVDL